MNPIPYLLLSWMLQAPAPPLFEITAGGKRVELHDFPGGVFGQVEIARPTEVEVRARFDIRWVDIRPKSAGIKPAIASDHASFRFRMDRPAPLTIEFNGDWKRVIHLFGNSPERNPLKPDAPNFRYFGPGTHEPGLIELNDNETLYLAEGAWVKGIVASVGTRNIAIRGRGILDGSGLPRRNMIYLEGAENARVEGITIVNSQTWTFNARRSNGLRVDGIRILNGRGPCSTDGIDLVWSSDALVENVFIRNTDDREVHDMTVGKAVFWNEPRGNAVEIGFELRWAPRSPRAWTREAPGTPPEHRGEEHAGARVLAVQRSVGLGRRACRGKRDRGGNDAPGPRHSQGYGRQV